jgi:hypothetical protein
MSVDPTCKAPLPQPRQAAARIEYLDHRSAPDHREYRLAIHTAEGQAEVRFRIASAAFVAKRVQMQDGPDVCYQILLRILAAGDTPGTDVITVGDAELAAYRDAHTPAPRRRSRPPVSTPKPPSPARTQPFRTSPKLPVAAVSQVAAAEPAFGEGRRVSHAVFGPGVTVPSSEGHTSVHFDGEGLKTFVTSLLELEVLSEPLTWEVGPRGKCRPREAARAS